MQSSIPPTQIYLLHTTADPINSQDVDPQLMANRRPTASISAGIPSFAIPITSDEIHDHSVEYSSVISLIEFKPIPYHYVSCFVTPSFMVFNSMLAGCFTPIDDIQLPFWPVQATILPHSVPAISRDQWLHVCRPTPSSAIRCSSTPPSPAERQWATQGGSHG